MKRSVLLLFGGESSEHEVSITSARNVYDALDKTKYDAKLGYISKDGNNWLLVESFDVLNGPSLLPVPGRQAFETSEGEIKIDVIFPVLHGVHGEDGEVQGLARLLHAPCVGPGLIGAAVTMDKDVTKRLLRDSGVPVVDWLTWQTSDPAPAYGDVVSTLGKTLFVKPANAGSSVGVSKVKSFEEYEKALGHASGHDRIVLIERAVSAAREIEVAIIGNGADIQVSTPGEIIPGEEFYSYDDKYSDASASQVKIPAELSKAAADEITRLARKAYITTRGQGMARIDFFLDRDNNVYLNEINAIPGFTNISMYPKLWQYDGVNYSDLIERLILLAIEASQ